MKLRYLDPPVFVDVGSVVASYNLSQNASAGINVIPNSAPNGSVAGSVGLSSSPTITYTPMTGNDYIKGLTTPLSAEVLFTAMQNGYPADSVLFSTFVSINGLRNQQVGVEGITPADPGFHRVRELMREIQVSGAVRLYVKRTKKGEDKGDSEEVRVIALRTKDIPDEVVAKIIELRQLLHLNPNADEFVLTSAPLPSNDTEIAVQTRSIMQLLKSMALQVEVPSDDVTRHKAVPGFHDGNPVPGVVPLIHIRSSKQKPDDAFVAVHYRNAWFRIDDDDLISKSVFAELMELFTMIDTTNKQNLPVVTIPAR